MGQQDHGVDDDAHTLVVSVTYGARWHLLRQGLASARDQGAYKALVIDNGSVEDIARLADTEFGAWVTVVRLGRNLGSAAGFARGLEAALKEDCKFVLLLDDDNVLSAGALSILKSELEKATAVNSVSAVFALRKGHGEGNLRRLARGFRRRVKDSVFEFHVADIPAKIRYRMLHLGGTTGGDKYASRIPMASGPYGGLLLPVDVIHRVGFPNIDFVLYQDDTEFTQRIPALGGALYIVPEAVIEDVDVSWHGDGESGSSFHTFLLGSSDFRVYYTFRNRAYLDAHIRRPRGASMWANSVLYLVILTAMALKMRRLKRLRLLISAWDDAWFKRMGVNERFTLP